MKISFGNLVLCDGAVRGVGRKTGVSNFRIGDQREVQVSSIINAIYKRIKARGNKIVNVRFDVQQEHDSVQAAEAYVVGLYATLPDQDALTISSVGGGGGVKNADFDAAALQASEHYYEGVRTFHHYEFVIGAAHNT